MKSKSGQSVCYRTEQFYLLLTVKDAIERTDDQLEEALAYVEERDESQICSLAERLRKPLILMYAEPRCSDLFTSC